MVTKTISNRKNRSLRAGHFVIGPVLSAVRRMTMLATNSTTGHVLLISVVHITTDLPPTV